MSASDRWSEADLAAKLSQSHARVIATHGGLPQLSTPPVVTAPVPPDRYKSATERRFAAELDEWQRHDTILGWWYEPMKGLYLAPKTTYTPDFMTCRQGEGLVIYEVKGAFIREKDRQKLKQAAALYWCLPFVLAQWKEAEWHYTRIPSS